MCGLTFAAENDGFKEGVRGYYSEHRERGGGSDNGVRTQNSSLSTGAYFDKRRGPSNASPLEADD